MCRGPSLRKSSKAKETTETEIIDSNYNIKDGKTGEYIGKKDDIHDFHWSITDEPHKTRRMEILTKYPEIKKLFGVDKYLKYKVLMGIMIQLYAGSQMEKFHWKWILLFAYTLGGSINSFLQLAMHEISHNLAFKKPLHNRLLGFVANLPFIFPASISFKRYHMEHHKYQGDEIIDVDLPTALEAHVIGGVRPFKAIWLFFNILSYAVRPLIIRPLKPTIWEFYNFLVQFIFNGLVLKFMGIKCLVYFALGTMLGIGIHPIAGHFIAEHFVFNKSQETYSYYGPLNWLTFNVGYHNEHHDFPFIPGSRLPLVRAIAPEYYQDLPHYCSWTKVVYDFIMDPSITLYDRMKRITVEGQDDVKVEKMN